jgi:hypothetical protein
MTMARFHAAPLKGPLDQLQHICGYLQKYPDAAIRFSTKSPNQSVLEHATFDWGYNVAYMVVPMQSFLMICLLQEVKPSIPPPFSFEQFGAFSDTAIFLTVFLAP